MPLPQGCGFVARDRGRHARDRRRIEAGRERRCFDWLEGAGNASRRTAVRARPAAGTEIGACQSFAPVTLAL